MADDSLRREAVEIDLMVALAMARAATAALLAISPVSHREICAALSDELSRLGLEHDAKAAAAAALLKQLAPISETY